MAARTYISRAKKIRLRGVGRSLSQEEKMQIESLEMQAAAALEKAKTLNYSFDTGPDQPSLGTLLGTPAWGEPLH
jgi:hypothetical protein